MSFKTNKYESYCHYRLCPLLLVNKQIQFFPSNGNYGTMLHFVGLEFNSVSDYFSI